MDSITRSRFKTDPRFDKERSYWRGVFPEPIGPPSGFPTDNPEKAGVAAIDATRYTHHFPNEAARALHELSRGSQTACFTILLSTLRYLLYRYTGNPDMIIGSPVFRADYQEKRINSVLPLSGRLDPLGSFKDLLQQSRTQVLGAREHQNFPIETVWELSGSPPANSYFEVSILLDGLHHPRYLESYPSPFNFHFFHDGGMLKADIQYSDAYQKATVHRIAIHFQHLFVTFLDNPRAVLNDCYVLDPEQRRRLIVDFNATECAGPQTETLPHLFCEWAERSPDACAVEYLARSWTYRDLNQLSDAIAHRLTALGAGPENRIGVMLERGPFVPPTIFGILKTGAVYVPLSPDHPTKRLNFLIQDAKLSLLITHTGANSIPANLPCPLLTLAEEDLAPIRETPEFPIEAHPQLAAYMIYTSGSTGKPKGVVNTHRGLLNTSWHQGRLLGLAPGKRMLQLTSLVFDASLFEIGPTLANGACLVFIQHEDLLSGSPLKNKLKESQPTHLFMTPSAIAPFSPEDLPSLEMVIVGGEPCSSRLVEIWAASCKFLNAYGPTENSICSTLQHLPPGLTGKPPIGRPNPNMHAFVLDRDMHPVPPGVVGELHLGGPGLARCYWRRPDLTAAVFVPNPFPQAPNERLYKTGDLVRCSEGGPLEFIGRRDFQVKVRGFRIELQEIEAVISGLPEIEQAVVVPHTNKNGVVQLIAYVVAEFEPKPGPEMLETYLQSKLPDYMVPSAFLFLDKMPQTTSGKIDRKALPEPELLQKATKPYVAPRNETETILARIWGEVLGVSLVGIHHSLYELGGDSILALQIVARANQAGIKIRARQLFEAPTVAQLARVAQNQAVAAETEVVTGPVPLTPIQAWFFETHPTNPRHFHMDLCVEVPPPITREIMRKAYLSLIKRHDALRIRFQIIGKRVKQECRPDEESAPFVFYDLSEVAPKAREAQFQQEATKLRQGMMFSEGFLVAGAWFQMEAGRPARFLLVMHHLIVDAVSIRILFEDLSTACTQLLKKQPLQFLGGTTPYTTWADRLHKAAQSEALSTERDYWLTPARSSVQPLPIERPANLGRNTSANTRSVASSLDKDYTSRLLQSAPAAYFARINELLVAALFQTIAEWTGHDHLLLDIEGHGREDWFEDVDISRTVGWFTTIVPAYFQCENLSDPGEVIYTVKETLRRLPHHGAGYGILRYLSTDQTIRSALAEQPQPCVSFNYLGQVEQTIAQAELFQPFAGELGRMHEPNEQRPHLLDVEGIVIDGELKIDWVYCPQLHDEKTITRLAVRFMHHLRELIKHCQALPQAVHTPADFPAVSLTREELDQLATTCQDHEIESIYPLVGMQAAMLKAMRAAPGTGVYVVQLGARLTGLNHPQKFRQAWELVIERQPALRTRFQPKPNGGALQIIYKQDTLTWEQLDWRAMEPNAWQRNLEAYMQADREKGFDLSTVPPLRVAYINLSATETYLLISYAHPILDGWSYPLLMQEVFTIYQSLVDGAAPNLPPVPSPADYHAWRKSRDHEAATTYWREVTKDYKLVDFLAEPATPKTVFAGAERTLKAEALQNVQTFAREKQLTLNILVMEAWGWALSKRHKTREVVFSVTTAGRPEDLPGMDTRIGLFLNTLPIRISYDDSQDRLTRLKDLADRQRDHEQHGFLTSGEIAACTHIPIDRLESNYRFQNYPMRDALDEDGDIGVDELRGWDHWHQPLNLVASLIGEDLRLELNYRTDCFDEGEIQALLIAAGDALLKQ